MDRRSSIINIVTVAFVLVTLILLLTEKHGSSPLAAPAANQSVTSGATLVPARLLQGPARPDRTASAPAAVGSMPALNARKLSTAQPVAPTDLSAGTLTRSGIIADTNAERTSRSLSALTESAQLDASAQAKADDILARQYFEHVAPDGTTVSMLVTDQGYAYIRIGENLALGDFSGDQDVVTAWMNSPEHRANMLFPEYRNIGVGVAAGIYKGQAVVVAVQHFGTPVSVCPTVDPSLKQSVTAADAHVAALSSSLQALKVEIDSERQSGEDVSALASSYNAGISTYDTQYAAAEKLRQKYNAQVAAFNSCVTSEQ